MDDWSKSAATPINGQLGDSGGDSDGDASETQYRRTGLKERKGNAEKEQADTSIHSASCHKVELEFGPVTRSTDLLRAVSADANLVTAHVPRVSKLVERLQGNTSKSSLEVPRMQSRKYRGKKTAHKPRHADRAPCTYLDLKRCWRASHRGTEAIANCSRSTGIRRRCKAEGGN